MKQATEDKPRRFAARPCQLMCMVTGSGWIRAAVAVATLGGCVVLPDLGSVIVRIGDEGFRQEDFDAFLRSRGGFLESPGPAVLSALLDEFVRERLLVLAALEAGVAVSAAELQAEIEALAAAPGSEEAPPEREVRDRLLVGRFLDEVIFRDLEVTESDLALEMQAAAPLYRGPATMTLSEARFETRAEAERAEAALTSQPDAAAVEFHPIGIFRGGELPEILEAAVRGRSAGEFTRVLEISAGLRIFRVDAVGEPGDLSPEAVEPLARRAILERRAEALVADLLADVRERHPVEVFSGRLSFPYLGREPEESRN